jgi:alkanesulfonate monooxygenase SsuD/methylene tetrahydromethanopterin reductase-like flavin-dependent oxidoreductase (luciferase family)
VRNGRVKAALRPHAAWWVQRPPCQGRNRLVGAIWKLLRCQSPRRQAHPTPLKSALIYLRSERFAAGAVVGSPETVKKGLHDLVSRTGADELMISTVPVTLIAVVALATSSVESSDSPCCSLGDHLRFCRRGRN